MIIAQINGGRGNQLSQYAIARRLSYKLNTELKIDKSCYDFIEKLRDYTLTEFNINVPYATKEEIDFYKKNHKEFDMKEVEEQLKRIGICDEDGFIPNVVNYPIDIYLKVSFGEKNFADASDIIRKDLTLRVPPSIGGGYHINGKRKFVLQNVLCLFMFVTVISFIAR